MDVPTITRNDDGTFAATFPDPPQRSYEVAHEIIVEHVALLNRVARLERVMRETLEYGTDPDTERVFREVLGMDAKNAEPA